MAETTTAAAAAASKPRDKRISGRVDHRDRSRPGATRRPEETIQVAGDGVTDADLAAEMRHLHGCPSAERLADGATLEDPEVRIEFFNSDGVKKWGEARVPITLRIARCVDCGEQVKAEMD